MTANRVWLSVVTGPLLWSAQGLLGWWISGRACNDGVADWGPLSASGIRTLLMAIGIVALGATAAAGLAARSAGRPIVTEGRDPLQFISTAGVYITAAFTVGILWAIAASATLPVCELGR
jgi:hypothetical protein